MFPVMRCKRAAPRVPEIHDTVLEALRHSLSASRLSATAQIHAREPNRDSFQSMAEAADKMINALDSLHETLQTLILALTPRDIDLSWHLTEKTESFRPNTCIEKPTGPRKESIRWRGN